MARSSLKAAVTPEVLRWARESLGLTVDWVAGILSLDPEALRGWETGAEQPSMKEAKRLASIYRRPFAVFFLPSPPAEPAPPKDFRTLATGAPLALSLNTLLAMRRARWLQATAGRLAEELHIAGAKLSRASIHDDPGVVAQTERQRIGIGVDEQLAWRDPGDALRSWRGALEQQGVVVLQLAFPIEDARGFSLNGEGMPSIVVNRGDAPVARIFTLFHEYAHLLLRSPGVCLPDPSQKSASKGNVANVERFCDRFAGHFLVPIDALRQHLSAGAPNAQVRSAAARWKVSGAVLWRQMRNAGLISADQYWRELDSWSAPPAAKPKPDHFVPPPAPKRIVGEVGTFFGNLVMAAHQRELITTSDVADYLGAKVRDLPRISQLLDATHSR